ncbi:lasso peptide biosynthesis B2 protein [Novosphingobium album (ex Liu et al. 2023)]|nr:lasso peptide biosynthesis B2 protein [Novosphingobium album (ex Liu et al. 2023)]
MVIFLDVRRNRYLALASRTASALIEEEFANVPGPILQTVAQMGWFAPDARPLPGATAPTLANRELAALARHERGSRALIGQALVALVYARISLRTMPLERLLAAVARRSANAGARTGSRAIADLVAAFETTARFTMPRNSCLPRALALHALLARHGHACTLSFGVKLHPFEAHCWLQRDAVLINDTIEQVGLFVPIMAIR